MSKSIFMHKLVRGHHLFVIATLLADQRRRTFCGRKTHDE